MNILIFISIVVLLKNKYNLLKIMKEIDYYFYMDESGCRNPGKQLFCRNDGMDYFALGGILILNKDRVEIIEKYNTFCKKWNIDYPLHSTDIRGMRNDFIWLNEDSKRKERFLSELEYFLISIPVIGFASIIHRPGYNERYKEKYKENQWLMCRTTFNILIERISKYLKKNNNTVVIRYEECGKEEEKNIVKYLREMKNTGHPFDEETSKKYNPLETNDYKNIILGEPKRKKKANAFIQIADIYLYPMVKRIYDPKYNPWVVLHKNGKVIDSYVPEINLNTEGIKYSCFENCEFKDTKKPE